MNRLSLLTLQALVLLTVTANPGRSEEADNPVLFSQVSQDYQFQFPRSHGSHPSYATEWWYFTGHLATNSSYSYGFELTFFRVGINPIIKSPSDWAVQSLFLAHFAITDDEAQKFYFFEATSRDNFSRAGAANDTLNVWVGPWRAQMLSDGKIQLSAAEEGTALELTLSSAKPVVLQGENGVSRKAEQPGDASYYSSFTRLNGSGTLTIEGKSLEIKSASAWMDHEVTSSSLARGVEGWDWFAVQLDSEEELMVYQLRKADGSISPYSSGTFVSKSGESIHLAAKDFNLQPTSHWTSPITGISYPANWKLRVERLGINLNLEPTVPDQELRTTTSTGVTYWEGRAKAKGQRNGEQVLGNAYIELVGYSRSD